GARPAHPSAAPDQTRIDAARADTGIHRAQQGLESARLDVCRADDSLRVHAGHGSGERSSRGLRQPNRRGSCARDLPFSLTDQIDEPILKRFREVFASLPSAPLVGPWSGDAAMALTRPPAVSVFGITALIPGVGRFNALSSVASLLM